MSFFDTLYLEFRDSPTAMDSRFRGNDDLKKIIHLSIVRNWEAS